MSERSLVPPTSRVPRTTRWSRATRTVLAVLAVSVAACAKSTTDATQTPAAIRAASGTLQTGTVGTALTVPLSVVVTDAAGKAIAGAVVQWDASAGSGTTNPSASETDAKGAATAIWTVGTTAGTQRVTANVSGVAPVTFIATVIAGPAISVIATPEQAFLGIGDTLRIRAAARDQYGNDITGQALTFTSIDATIASVSTAGLVSAIGLGNTRIIAAASGKADTIPITVLAAGASACGTTAPRELALGEVFIPSSGATSANTCISAPVGVNGEYALTMISTAVSFGTVTPLEVYALGNTAPTVAAISAGLSAVFPSAQNVPMTVFDAPPTATLSAPQRAEFARRTTEREELRPLVNAARDWQAARQASLIKSVVIDAKVGDIIKLNANANQGCSNPDTRIGRVAAVGTRGIVVADTANPTGGYTDTEYAGVAATFDTLIFPMDTTAFGAPSNISQYGKIILFFTRNVNALTPANAGYTIGGFFFARDLYPKTTTGLLLACPSSNVQEMFYLLAPDPNGTVNGNKRTKDQVSVLNQGTIAHEFQHLINSSRRLYVNTSAVSSEETWLDEGLAHTAEELLYFRISGYTSRQNLGLADVSNTPLRATTFSNYASQNFSRFYTFITNTEINSPYAPNDSLATRGATWNFLRYAAGRQGASGEAAFYRSVVNSNTSGIANLNNAIPGGAFNDYLRDWTVALIADDFSAAELAALDPRYTIPAWNFRSIYPGLRFSGGTALGTYPINARLLANNVPQRITLAGGTSSYVRFGIPSGKATLLTLSSNGAALPSTLRFAVVRLK